MNRTVTAEAIAAALMLDAHPNTIATSDGPGYASFGLSYQPSSGGAYANLALVVKNASGGVVAQTSSTNGSLTLETNLPTVGAYSVEVAETTTSLGTPGYILTTAAPDYREDLISFKLYDQANTLLATGAGTTTRALTASLTPGVYKLSIGASEDLPQRASPAP